MFHVYQPNNELPNTVQHHEPTFRNDSIVRYELAEVGPSEDAPTKEISIKEEGESLKKKKVTPGVKSCKKKKLPVRNLKIQKNDEGNFYLTYSEVNDTIFGHLRDDRLKSMAPKFKKHQRQIETLTRNQSKSVSPEKSPSDAQELLDNFRFSIEYEKQNRDKKLTTYQQPLPVATPSQSPKKKRSRVPSIEDKMKILSNKHMQKL